MPRKEKTVAEVFIAFCMTAKEDEIAALIATAQTVVNTRFPVEPKKRKKRKGSGPVGVVRPAGIVDAETKTPAPVLGAAQETAAAQSPRRRARPPVVPPTPAEAASDELPPQTTGDE